MKILAMVRPSLNSPRNKANHVSIDLTFSLRSSADRESLPVAVIVSSSLVRMNVDQKTAGNSETFLHSFYDSTYNRQ